MGGLYPRCFFDGSPRYGAPGVELTGLHKETATVTQLHFLPGQVRGCPCGGNLAAAPQHLTQHPLSSCLPQGWLLSLLDDNTLHLWEVCQKEGCSHLEETRSFGLPGRPGSGSAKYLPGGIGAAPPRGCGRSGAAAGWERRVGAASLLGWDGGQGPLP